MGRNKIYFKHDDPITVVRIVEAVVCDVPRKERAITYSSVSPELLAQYIATNAMIQEAVAKIEPALCRAIMNDIIDHIGYRKSNAATFASKGAYYRRKRMFIHDIAVGLMLV